jgi:hypothetical protein
VNKNGHVLNDMLPYHAYTSFAWSLLCIGTHGYYSWMRSREWFQSNTSTMRAHQRLCKVTSFYSQTHAINSKNWLLFECCFALLVAFVGLMESEGTLKSCQTNLRKYDHMANSKYKHLHLPPLHDDVESTSRTTLFEAGGMIRGGLRTPPHHVHQQHTHSSPTSSRRGRDGRRRTTGKKLGSAGPTPAKAGLNTGYSRSARVNHVLAMKPPMSSISLVIKLHLARGCLYMWVTLPSLR